MNNTQEQATQCHRHGKEFKQWWSTAKDTLKCDEGGRYGNLVSFSKY